jgi:UMF1 family MFS transporter
VTKDECNATDGRFSTTCYSPLEIVSNQNRKTIFSWALYDWANSAFATTVMAGFFPVFFKSYWSANADVTVSTFQLGAANSAAGLALAFVAPLLGAIADAGGYKKRFLFAFASLGIAMTASLWFVSHGAWVLAAVFYVIAALGFAGGNIFYDALLVHVAPADKMNTISAFGFSLGYLGGGILFAINIFMLSQPQLFGLAGPAEAVRFSFLSVALWWALFAVPLFIFVREPLPATSQRRKYVVRAGLGQLINTFKEIRNVRTVFLFLIAYFLYIDGVDTVIRMAVDYGMSLGLKTKSLLSALLLTQFVGFPSALLFGKLGERWGAKRGILLGICIYLLVITWGAFIDNEREFFALAIAVGLVQGGVQALSRSLYAQIIPVEKAAQFFGFYNMWGKFAAVLGPFLMGWVGLVTGNPRYSILAIGLLFIAGALLLLRVNVSPDKSAPFRDE